MTKNKIKALLLAICIMLPSMFALTACGHKHKYSDDWTYDATNHWHICTGEKCTETKGSAKHTFVTKSDTTKYWLECSVCGYQQEKVTGTVTSEQWTSALNFDNVTNFNWKKNGSLYVTDIRANSTSVSTVMTVVSNGAIRSKTVYTIEEEEGTNSVYEYKYNKDFENDITKDLWTRTKKATSTDEIFSLVNPKSSFSQIVNAFSSFSYNSENAVYESTGTVTYGGQPTNLKLKFANTKLVWVEITYAEDHWAAGSIETVDISYDETDVEQANLSTVNATQWQKILSFENVKNFTMNGDYANTSNKITVTETKAKREITRKSDNKKDVSVYDIENAKKYNKSYSADKYTQTDFLTDYDIMLAIVGNPANFYNSILDSFETFEYKADEKVYYIASAKIGYSEDVQGLKLTFNNGHLTKVEYKVTSDGTQSTNTITYTYGDASVTVPTGDELAS